MKVINPSNHQEIQNLIEDNSQTIKEKFNKLTIGQISWAHKSIDERIDCIVKFSALLE